MIFKCTFKCTWLLLCTSKEKGPSEKTRLWKECFCETLVTKDILIRTFGQKNKVVFLFRWYGICPQKQTRFKHKIYLDITNSHNIDTGEAGSKMLWCQSFWRGLWLTLFTFPWVKRHEFEALQFIWGLEPCREKHHSEEQSMGSERLKPLHVCWAS